VVPLFEKHRQGFGHQGPEARTGDELHSESLIFQILVTDTNLRLLKGLIEIADNIFWGIMQQGPSGGPSRLSRGLRSVTSRSTRERCGWADRGEGVRAPGFGHSKRCHPGPGHGRYPRSRYRGDLAPTGPAGGRLNIRCQARGRLFPDHQDTSRRAAASPSKVAAQDQPQGQIRQNAGQTGLANDNPGEGEPTKVGISSTVVSTPPFMRWPSPATRGQRPRAWAHVRRPDPDRWGSSGVQEDQRRDPQGPPAPTGREPSPALPVTRTGQHG